ncbi:MAG: glycosyltransferase, partial [Bacteroidia bacterium]|nr:glycosyltransferase [Bacteroidia bacterium]
FEGMPTVVLEAMAKKMPIIVTDVGATLELVDMNNGYIIDKKSVQSLFDALQAFHQLPKNNKTQLAEASYNRVKENFTWPVIAQKHIDLFKQIAQSTNA